MHRARFMLITASMVCVLAPLGGIEAAVYKWKDDQGVTQYSQLPPPDRESERVHTGPSTKPAGTPPTTAAEQQAPAAAGAGDQPAPAGAQTEPTGLTPEQMQENCRIARQNLETLQNNPRILTKGKDGQMVRLTEEERQAKIVESQKQIEEFCKE